MRKSKILLASAFSFLLLSTNITFAGSVNSADQQSEKKAKYVFYFIGDGMGFSHIALAEAYKAAEKGIIGSESLEFTKFPVMGMQTSYSASNLITCSSAAGTALSTGFKTKNHMLGMNPDTIALQSISYKIHEAGIPVGIMSSVTLDHATPGAFYGHSASRSDYYSIAKELPLTHFEFFGGGGLEGAKDKRNADKGIEKSIQDNGYTVAYGVEDFNKKKGNSSRMILLQEKNSNEILPTMWARSQKDLTLAQVVKSAIDFLDNDNGFFIMAEGGQIDWGAHSNDIPVTIFETLDFDQAIAVAYDFYLKHPDETLIVVTADHETGGVSLGKKSGYTFNLSPIVKMRKQKLANENSVQTASKRDVSNYMDQIPSDSMSVVTKIGWTTTSHTGGAVPIFAVGKGSELFAGRMNNVDLPRKICQAMGVTFDNKVKWYYPRMAEFKKEKPITSNDIVFLGNSLTQGAADMSAHFPQTTKKLAQKGARLVNRGIIGETTVHFYERIDEILKAKPAKLFIMGGVNDLAGGASAQEICDRLQKIVKAVKETSPKTKIYLESLLPINESFNRYKALSGKTDEVLKVNSLIEKMAKAEKIQYVNLYPSFVEAGSNNLNKDLTSDGLHLTETGYEKWASLISKLVK